VNTVKASFTITEQMTEMSQRKKAGPKIPNRGCVLTLAKRVDPI